MNGWSWLGSVGFVATVAVMFFAAAYVVSQRIRKLVFVLVPLAGLSVLVVSTWTANGDPFLVSLKLSMEKLWNAYWPLVIGGMLAAVGHRMSGWTSGAGFPHQLDEQTKENGEETRRSHFAILLQKVKENLDLYERGLRTWSTAGLMVLTGLIVLMWLLSQSVGVAI